MKSTIRSIAELSGLSPATVDRALHNRAHVSPATRQRVLETARRVGYLPESGATALPVKLRGNAAPSWSARGRH